MTLERTDVMQNANDTAREWLRESLSVPTPFPWQMDLLSRFLENKLARAIDIPTGLGKTSVIAIWLIARALCPRLPRRLVYVVDRRAVVDQATEVAEELRRFVERTPPLKHALCLGDRALPISTLRGQFVDNKEWLENPASPALIIGTVDMVGSRLLFEGYGTSRKMRPYQAGLLGVDTLVVLDEAHLVPPFEKLLEAIAIGNGFGPRENAQRELIPPFRLLSLSATGRTEGESFGLEPKDLDDDVVRRRLAAPKHLAQIERDEDVSMADALANEAWRLHKESGASKRILVFCNKREDASKALDALEKLARSDKTDIAKPELLVGGRRVYERTEATERLRALGFVAGSQPNTTLPTFLLATSAGEVGIDLDADHMAGDLVAWERMIQRLGRVNRRGNGDAKVAIVTDPRSKELATAEKKVAEERSAKENAAVLAAARALAVRTLISHLPGCDGDRDASPGALRDLKLKARTDAELQRLIDQATTAAPLYPALTRALVDAWSMTSLRDHTGRPEINPWLRGWIEEPPQTAVVWRRHLPTAVRPVTQDEIEAFFEAAPPHASETLETETYQVFDWLLTRSSVLGMTSADQGDAGDAEEQHASSPETIIAFVLGPALDVRWTITLGDLVDDDALKKKHEQLRTAMSGGTLVVDARIKGLKAGLLDKQSDEIVRTADDGQSWIVSAENDEAPVVRFRVAHVNSLALDPDPLWRERFRFARRVSEDGSAGEWLIISKWRHDGATEDDRSEGQPQFLEEHEQWTEDRARRIAEWLGLPPKYVEMLAVAARLHDEGKRSQRWQRAFNAPRDGVYAKTQGPVNVALLDGYRHELGSILSPTVLDRLKSLDADLQDLALHLIASHHGNARPLISTRGCEVPPSVLEEQAQEIAVRFSRLQKRWGPWGLAWWESLLRSADQQASRDNDLRKTDKERRHE